ncbi:MAG: 50S ribosomal protein L1 [Candidatus Dojkabacteria bacterium]|jgi:large subunit ribosomal protein L1|nr:50S ribosomal protein L1 [Candidatus Dojkabacteria bacterium]MDD2270220.1 50S ribosomal protein L1 [Candidatus Dojkabacteria bacterium]
MHRGKKYKESIKNYNPTDTYSLKEGIEKVKKLSYSKFVGTLEVHADIIIPKDRDPKSIKGAYTLPHTSGNSDVKIAVFCPKELEKDAKDAGADIVGLEKLTKDIKAGTIEFDIAIATPSVMPQIAVLGKELGPRGLMPNPKSGTVTDDLAGAIKEYRQGKNTFACDESGVIHLKAGKLDMDIQELIDNAEACIKAIEEALNKPYEQAIKKLHLAPTMGASVKISYSRE